MFTLNLDSFESESKSSSWVHYPIITHAQEKVRAGLIQKLRVVSNSLLSCIVSWERSDSPSGTGASGVVFRKSCLKLFVAQWFLGQ